MELLDSIGPWLEATVRHAVYLVGGAAIAVVVLVLQVVFGIPMPVLPPTTLAIAALLFLLAASYLAYRDLRQQRSVEQGDLQTIDGLAAAAAAYVATLPTPGQWDHQMIYYTNSAKELIDAAYRLASRGLVDRPQLDAALDITYPEGQHVSERSIAPVRAIMALLDKRPRTRELVPGLTVSSGPDD